MHRFLRFSARGVAAIFRRRAFDAIMTLRKRRAQSMIGGCNESEEPRRGFFAGLPRTHVEFHAIAAVALIAVTVQFFQAVGCADKAVVDRASGIIQQQSNGADGVTLHLIRTLSRSRNELTCAAFARFEYAGRDNTHRDVEYRVAIDSPGRKVSRQGVVGREIVGQEIVGRGIADQKVTASILTAAE